MYVTNITKQLYRRSVDLGASSLNGYDGMDSSHRYLVFRGMSPDAADRLEQRVKELEEQLNFERQARLKAEQDVVLLTSEVQIWTERYEEEDKSRYTDVEAVKRRELEFNKLKQEYEKVLQDSIKGESSMKKKFQDTVQQLADQLEHLTKQKNRIENEKHNLLIEIGEANSCIDSANAYKSQTGQQLSELEKEVRRLRLENEDLSRRLFEVNNHNARFGQENQELKYKLKDTESSSLTIVRDRQKYMQEIDELKATIEELNANKPVLLSTISHLESELEDATSRLQVEAESVELNRVLVQRLEADLFSVKQRHDKESVTFKDELDAHKKRAQLRITELEEALIDIQRKWTRVEKENVNLVIEIRDITNEVEIGRHSSAEMSRRLKSSEANNKELLQKVEQLTTVIHSNDGDQVKTKHELARLIPEYENVKEKLEQSLRENKKLADSFRDIQSHLKEAAFQTQELQKLKKQLETQLEQQSKNEGELKTRLGEALRAAEQAKQELNRLREEANQQLKLKDDEIDKARKAIAKLNGDHQLILVEIEKKYKGDANKYRTNLEKEISQFQIDIESVSRVNNDLGRNNKSLVSKIHELENSLNIANQTIEDLKSQIVNKERQKHGISSQLDEWSARCEALDLARKNAELFAQEAGSRIEELTFTVTSLSTDRRNYDSELENLRTQLEQVSSSKRDFEERTEKLEGEYERVNKLLEEERRYATDRESAFRSLEKELKETRAVLDELEQKTIKENKRNLSKLQTRLREVESELEVELRKNKDFAADNKKLQKLWQEMSSKLEEEDKLNRDLENQLEAVKLTSAKYKRQLTETEEVVAIVTSKYRRLQQLLDEMVSSDSSQDKSSVIDRKLVINLVRGNTVAPATSSHESLHVKSANNTGLRGASMSRYSIGGSELGLCNGFVDLANDTTNHSGKGRSLSSFRQETRVTSKISRD